MKTIDRPPARSTGSPVEGAGPAPAILPPAAILAHRTALGMSQDQFARALDTHPRRVHEWEHGRAVPTAEQSRRMAGLKPAPPRRRMSPEDIKEVRRSLKMTQSQFGDELGMASGTIAAWERGVRRPGKAVERLIAAMVKRNESKS
jgi:DNA-binding transcriptional regulator YiaG